MLIEKPKNPPTNLAIIAIYIFKPIIYDAINLLKPGVNNETQLTDAIQKLLDDGEKVFAVELNKDEKRIDIGNPYSYSEAFNIKIKTK